MFPQEITLFLQELSINNNKQWFDANRKRYEVLKKDFFDLTQAVLFSMAGFEPECATLNPKLCVYRINRDIRFAKDKTPYKTYFSAAISKHGRKTEDPGYYFHIDENGILRIDGGLYNPETKRLNRIRDAISANPEEIRNIIEDKKFIAIFGGLVEDTVKTTPRGFSKEDPAIELIKYKSYVGQHEADILTLTEKELPGYIVKIMRELYPLVKYLGRKSI